MDLRANRLFITKLPENVTQSDLSDKFSNYGNILSSEIIQRKKVEDKSFFAYVNIECTARDLQRCFKDFAKIKWNGEYVEVQVAKENFLSRLKRERDSDLLSTKVTNGTLVTNGISHSFTKIAANKKIKYVSDDEISETSDLEDQNIPKTSTEVVAINVDSVAEENNCDTISKISETELIHSTCYNQNGTKSVESVVHDIDKRRVVADQKRMRSIMQMKQGFRQQKLQIQSALSNLDKKTANKIVFDSDDDEGKKQVTNSKRKKALLEDSDDEDMEVNFKVKKQFEGLKGQKLLELQSKFKNDSRFTLDERFIDEDIAAKEENTQNKDDEDGEYGDEKLKQLDILGQVLGINVVKKNTSEIKTDKAVTGMLRFDPSQPEHNIYEIKEVQVEQSKKLKKAAKETTKEHVECEKPEVTKSKYYKVTEDLKNVFQKDSSLFSLLSDYKGTGEVDKEGGSIKDQSQKCDKGTEHNNKKEQTQAFKKSLFSSNLDNVFKYDSSDDDDDDQRVSTQPLNESGADKMKIKGLEKTKTATLWTEPFFFKNEDDYRLQEGLDFVRRFEVENGSDFSKLRRSLKQLVRAKVRNNQSKNKLFKKKLGGRKKRIKMKKALKV